jgi:hypothetical protein
MRTLILLPILISACSSQSSNPLDSDADFVAVSRSEISAPRRAALATAGAPAPSEEEFYLAINKKALGERFFLSAFMKQFFPGAVSYGAGRSLGTRVVSFKVQNGKLFVFDADARKKTSDTFDPQVIVEAYPIISDYGKYVTFDPAAGLNRFGVVSDAYAVGSSAEHFEVELSFLQRFRSLSDGATWEQVFTGFGEIADTSASMKAEGNAFRGSGTLGIALRRYKESVDFKPTELPPKEHYFRSDLQLVPNEGKTKQFAVKWNIKPGMAPIEWIISDQVAEVAADPKYAGYDIVGAMKRGVENWNSVFGFTAFTARLANPGESYADDDKNFIIFDKDPTYGAAFANWRRNPNTGEIRGASVYFNAIWLDGHDRFTDDPASPTLRLTWDGVAEQPLCNLPAQRPDHDGARPALASDSDTGLTKQQKFENYITHTIVHEIGHDLGLRHNFKGSLVSPTTSVMDYVLDGAATLTAVPQSYDIAAVKYLYGLSPDLPKDAFCTDDDTTKDPECARFDESADPLNSYYGPLYKPVLADYLSGASATPPNNTLNNVLRWVRAGKSAQKAAAFTMVTEGLRAPLDAAVVAALSPLQKTRVDAMARRILARLFIDAASLRGSEFPADPTPDPMLTPMLLAELKGNLLNGDGLRQFPTRRICVDILKKLQTQEAYQILVAARASLAVERLNLSGVDLVLADDLAARIDNAMHPYFLN